MADGKVLHASHDGVHVLRYIGDIRYTLTPSINRFLEGVFAGPKPAGFVIDLTQADSIDSTNLGQLARIAMRMQELEAPRVTLVSNRTDINSVLASMALDEVFDIVEDTGTDAGEVLFGELGVDADAVDVHHADAPGAVLAQRHLEADEVHRLDEVRAGEVEVRHGDFVTAIPVSLRGLFLRERRLLGILPRAAYETGKRGFRVLPALFERAYRLRRDLRGATFAPVHRRHLALAGVVGSLAKDPRRFLRRVEAHRVLGGDVVEPPLRLPLELERCGKLFVRGPPLPSRDHRIDQVDDFGQRLRGEGERLNRCFTVSDDLICQHSSFSR